MKDSETAVDGSRGRDVVWCGPGRGGVARLALGWLTSKRSPHTAPSAPGTSGSCRGAGLVPAWCRGADADPVGGVTEDHITLYARARRRRAVPSSAARGRLSCPTACRRTPGHRSLRDQPRLPTAYASPQAARNIATGNAVGCLRGRTPSRTTWQD